MGETRTLSPIHTWPISRAPPFLSSSRRSSASAPSRFCRFRSSALCWNACTALDRERERKREAERKRKEERGWGGVFIRRSVKRSTPPLSTYYFLRGTNYLRRGVPFTFSFFFPLFSSMIFERTCCLRAWRWCGRRRWPAARPAAAPSHPPRTSPAAPRIKIKRCQGNRKTGREKEIVREREAQRRRRWQHEVS